ncbi:MAG: polysaccharide deacetylase family protein [Armatimonadetes bacterium]|nr:polysaccharide deacetylase family protein [Armatimonadota bacterium]
MDRPIPKPTLINHVLDWTWENYRTAFVLGTGAIVMALHAAFGGGRTELWLGAWGAVLALGAALEPCVNPHNEIVGHALWRGSDRLPRIALTFDDGPWPPYTEGILDVLRREGVPASFFVVGRQARRYPELIRRMKQEGHLVGNHTESHRNLLFSLPEVSRTQIEQGAKSIEEVLGEAPVWFRPPWGMRAPWTLRQVVNANQRTALWTICPRDWQRPGPDSIVHRILKTARPGNIVLLHDGNGDRSQTVQALPEVIRGLRQLGYQFATVEEMARDLEALGQTPETQAPPARPA